MTYDLLGRKIQVDDPSGSTKFGYDAWGNLEHLTDAADRRTEFVYDSSGRLTEEIRPMQQSTGYEYDKRCCIPAAGSGSMNMMP